MYMLYSYMCSKLFTIISIQYITYPCIPVGQTVVEKKASMGPLVAVSVLLVLVCLVALVLLVLLIIVAM